MSYRYADLVYDDRGTPSVAGESVSPVPLRTEDEVVVPEERVEVEAPYRDRHGREATLRGWVSLPAIIRTADVKRGPDGLPARRPLAGTAPKLEPWERMLGDPRYVISDDQVEKVWDTEIIPLEEWIASLVQDVIEADAVRRHSELVRPFARTFGDPAAAVDVSVGLGQLARAAAVRLLQSKTHAEALEVAQGASLEIREWAP